MTPADELALLRRGEHPWFGAALQQHANPDHSAARRLEIHLAAVLAATTSEGAIRHA